MRFRNLKTQLEDIEFTVFRSKKYQNYLSGAIEYQMNLWHRNMKSMSLFERILYRRSIEDLNVRALSILSYTR